VDKKREARRKMLKDKKSEMKGEMGKDYDKKHGRKLASVQVVAPEKKMPEALSVAQKLMSSHKKSKKDTVGYPDEKMGDNYKDGGCSDSDKKRKLMEAFKNAKK